MKKVYMILTVLFLLIAVPYARPYYRYCGLLVFANDAIRINAGNIRTIREEILSYTENKGIPLLKKDLSVYRDKKRTRVEIYWVDEVDLYGYYKRPLSFSINNEF